MATKKLSIKLLIDTKRSKVLFAEAGKDFVDFLFFLMGLPIGTVIQLLTKQMGGSITNIYESIENLNLKHFQSNQAKDSLIKPKLSEAFSPDGLFLSLQGSYDSAAKREYYHCDRCCRLKNCYYVSDGSNAVCPMCCTTMTMKLTYVPSGNPKAQVSTDNFKGGFVNGVATYMVMDDLVVEPILSAISSLNLLSKFDIKDRAHLQEHVVDLDMAKGLKLLKSSLETKSVLTTVFLGRESS